mmetsp:Transcript_2464/g.3761  ORF Transcript_2464/g.3761 Transcript_2464/m.3761 type:complete len:369 (-) Transcript_2464:889-1995(-)
MKLPFFFALVAALLFTQQTYAQIAKTCESMEPYSYDSGPTSKASTTITYATSPWIQLDLSGTTLASNTKLLIKGRRYTQEVDAAALADSGYSSVFDGDTVSLELVSSGGGTRNGNLSRIIVSNVRIGLCEGDIVADSICGLEDDRVASEDVRVGRMGGCSAWLISENVFIWAGHCGTPGDNTRIHFTYGTGSAATEDQYAVDLPTHRRSTGFGNDWGAGRFKKNSSTQKWPGVAQTEKCGTPGCGWYTLGPVPSQTTGNNIRITGYGVAAVQSRSQKTHIGELYSISSTVLRYRPDTTGGNSGSPVIHEETGNVIGVHTHGGCSQSEPIAGSNAGTRIDRPLFAQHVEFLMKSCSSDNDCDDGVFCNG